MTSVIAKLVLVGFLIPAALVFTVSYRHALRHWLRPVAPIPTASIAQTRSRVSLATAARHFHAAAIGAAFASASIMALIAVAIIGVAIVGTVIR